MGYEGIETTNVTKYFQQIGLKIGRNVFSGLHRVDPADLHKPDLLHNIYLGLFKHMMEWVEGFLKKHKRQQAFDDAWKALPPYPGFSVPKKAYREVTQWQGKEMRNLGRCISAVLASALQNPDRSQQIPFKRALECVSALIDFSLMAQYRSHTRETLSYMEKYLQTFHRQKDIFLEFRTSKTTRAQANRQDRELREQMQDRRAKAAPSLSAAQKRRRVAEERSQRIDQRADLLQRENHFNFIKMHYLTHFESHVRRFGSISMYSTDIGELAHKEQIKEGYRRSNKNEAVPQILSQYGRQHALGMRLQTIEALLKADNTIGVGNVPTEMPASPSRSVPRRVLRSRAKNTVTLTELCKVLDINYSDMMQEMLRYIKQTVANEWQLPTDTTALGLLPVEHFTQLEIPVPDFQESDVFQIHRARCTGTKAFRNAGPRNDWVWIQAGRTDTLGDLRGRLVARLFGLFKIRSVRSEVVGVNRLALVQVLNPMDSGRLHIGSGHVRVCKRPSSRDIRIVDIGTVIGQAHVVPMREGQWIVNHRIDLRTFNEIY